jgi:UDP-N-acetylglucosamine 2-epimerase (non-hydrolysing)
VIEAGEAPRPGVLVVVGTRPEAIKMAPVVEALRARGGEVTTHLVLTGQHRELVDDVLTSFGLTPDRDLGIMRSHQSPYDVIRASLDGLRETVSELAPRALLVQGDTATVFAGALVGFLERLYVGHVEAGLRSGDLAAPWPEEGFRRLTDVVTGGYFAPTPHAAANLVREGVAASQVHVTGNPVVDALRRMADADRPPADPVLAEAARRAEEPGRRLVLLTAHRRESFGQPLADVFSAVRALADEDASLEVVYPVHPNPQVHGPAHECLAGHPRIHLTGPVDYPDLLATLQRAALVLTDSGGIQEEAPVFGVPVLVLRDVTERPEGVEAGVAELVGTDPERIVRRARALLAGQGGRAEPAVGTAAAQRAATGGETPYGDGRAGVRIADLVIHHLTGAARRTTDWVPHATRAAGHGPPDGNARVDARAGEPRA